MISPVPTSPQPARALTRHDRWTPASWRAFETAQQPEYPDHGHLDEVLARIRRYPPLIDRNEVDALKRKLALAEARQAFLLQGGDCAERFRDVNREALTRKLSILMQMSAILCHGARKPIVRVGRFAGQYAKPRSQTHELVDGLRVPSFRGDNINGLAPTPEARTPDPRRLMTGYHMAALTLNYVRALGAAGFADLSRAERWALEPLPASPYYHRYMRVMREIAQATELAEALGRGEGHPRDEEAIYASHEGLLLPFEEALTQVYADGRAYNQSAHMLWIGERTRQLDGGHVAYFRGVANPVGLKIGPSAVPEDIAALCQLLNPGRESGKLVLIPRLGTGRVAELLPPLIEAVRATGVPALWSCDPMHGNAIRTCEGVKTRDFAAILSEVEDSFAVHQQCGSHLGGLHFEMTGDDVTECMGGAEGLSAQDLGRSYESACDPRLNATQSLEMAFLVAAMLAPTNEDNPHPRHYPADTPLARPHTT